LRENLLRSRSRKSLKEKNSEILRERKELPKLEKNSKKQTRNFFKSKLKLPLKRKKRKNVFLSMPRKEKLWSISKELRKMSVLNKNKQSSKNLLIDK
jgi:hypothetical protein